MAIDTQSAIYQLDAIKSLYTLISYNGCINYLITTGKLPVEEFPNIIAIKGPDRNIHHQRDWNIEDLKTTSNNMRMFIEQQIMIALNTALEITFGKSIDVLKIDDGEIDSARVIVYMLRNAFAHEPCAPRWRITKQKYKRAIEVKSIGLKIDFSDLDGKPLKKRYVGTYRNYIALIGYCIKHIEQKLGIKSGLEFANI